MMPDQELIVSPNKGDNNANLATKVYKNLNHMYQHCVSCTNEEIPELQEVFAENVMADVSFWIINQ